MKQFKKNLGKVSLTPEGIWDSNKEYEILSIVCDEHTQHGFISKKEVPPGVDLYNSEYWMPLNVSGFADNNMIILSKKTSDASIQSYTLEEAVKSIPSVGRRPGTILGFYNLNTDRLDIGGRWELWQYNAVDNSNWENVECWQSLYYNYNKFVGWYRSEELLKANNPFPEIGCYAFVGTQLNEATIYRCDRKYVWEDTAQHAWDYVKVIVDGNVTVGENGNWFNNGVDTNIPASIKGENGKTPLFRNNNNVIEVSYDNVEWNPISDEIAAWFRWQSEGGQQVNSVGKIQITRNGVTWTDLSGQFVNNLRISRYIGVDESLPTSGIVEGTIYAKGPTYSDEDINHANPIYRLWVYAWKGNTLAWVDNGKVQSIVAGVTQETGDSETEVMSQKAVTTKLSELGSKVGVEIELPANAGIVYYKQPYYAKSNSVICLSFSNNIPNGVYVDFFKNGNRVIRQAKYSKTIEDIQITDDVDEVGIVPMTTTNNESTVYVWNKLSIKNEVHTLSQETSKLSTELEKANLNVGLLESKVNEFDGELNNIYTQKFSQPEFYGYIFNGEIVNDSDTNWVRTDFIEVKEGDVFYLNLKSAPVTDLVGFYSSDKTLIYSINQSGDFMGKFIIPNGYEDLKYVRFCGKSDSFGVYTHKIEKLISAKSDVLNLLFETSVGITLHAEENAPNNVFIEGTFVAQKGKEISVSMSQSFPNGVNIYFYNGNTRVHRYIQYNTQVIHTIEEDIDTIKIHPVQSNYPSFDVFVKPYNTISYIVSEAIKKANDNAEDLSAYKRYTSGGAVMSNIATERDIKMVNTIEAIISACPHAQIMIEACYYFNRGTNDEKKRAYAEELRALCEFYGMKFINVAEIGIRETAANKYYTVDGIHAYTEKGSKLMYDNIKGQLLSFYGNDISTLKSKRILILGDSISSSLERAKATTQGVDSSLIVNTWASRMYDEIGANVDIRAIPGSGWCKKDGFDVLDQFNGSSKDYDLILIGNCGTNDGFNFGLSYEGMMEYLINNATI